MKYSQTIEGKILSRIYGFGRGSVFTPETFQDLGGQKAILQALLRHTNSGTIRRLARGLYDYPRKHPKLGSLEPTIENIVKALAGRDALRLQPTGAYAANLLGLSTQVPMKVVYLTDGRSRKVQVGKRQITLKQTTPRNMTTAGKISGLLIQALRHIGHDYVDDKMMAKIDKQLDASARKQLIKDIRYAPAWIAEIFRKVAAKGGDK